MLKKLMPLMILALLLPCAAFGAQTLLTEKLDLISSDVLGLRITPDLAEKALRIGTKWPTTICIKQLDLSSQHVTETTVTYSAQVKTAGLDGAAYLEMWLRFPGASKPVVTRGLVRPLKGTTGWSKLETSFTLSRGQVPDQVTMNLVIDGKGTVWIRDADLQRDP